MLTTEFYRTGYLFKNTLRDLFLKKKRDMLLKKIVELGYKGFVIMSYFKGSQWEKEESYLGVGALVKGNGYLVLFLCSSY